MGVAWFPVFESEVAGSGDFDGKVLAREASGLAAGAARLGVQPLEAFLSVGAEEMAELLGEDPEDFGGSDESGGPEWFSSSEGLATAQALVAGIKEHPGDYESPEDVGEELTRLIAVLEVAAAAAVRFRLMVDI